MFCHADHEPVPSLERHVPSVSYASEIPRRETKRGHAFLRMPSQAGLAGWRAGGERTSNVKLTEWKEVKECSTRRRYR